MNAQELLDGFLTKNVNQILERQHIEGLITGLDSALSFTHFDDPYDTLFYSQIIARALTLDSSIRYLYDFGAGSSIPTLLALKNTQRTDVEAFAVDIDPEAMVVGKKNADLLGLSSQYTFKLAPFESVLRSGLVKLPATLIVSNPPYIPVPQDMKSHEIIPIDGGPDGANYIADLLEQDYEPGTILALLWGSLTNPSRVIPTIEDKYEVLHAEALKIHFGKYTQTPGIYEHLYRLRDEGIVCFDGNKDEGESQIVLGTILRRR